ncbi:hypothetical protein AFLA_002582 [Aspergillus flavus NRRL3357]|nr:hypothetical protein AFLA_002582 [Aspergillus flavus NRRL3357]
MAATFSYAQAAKGVAPAQPSEKTAEPNQASKPEEQAEITTPEAENTETVKTEESQEAEKAPVNTDKDVESTAVESSKADVSGTSSPSVGTSSTSTLPKDDESSNTPNGTSESTWDKQSQASGTDKQSNGTENAKEKSAEKEKSEPPKELKAAPLPAVNIWQQRKEAQEAKAKAVASKPAGSAAKTGTSKTASAASSVSGDAQQDQSKAGSKKKGGDVEGAKDRRSKGRDDTASLPPVGDAALWPTPQSAQGEEKKKSEKSPVIRPSGKEKWTPVPYVPTAVFTTPLPSAARRGGRAPRAGRDGARNGTHGSAAAADKATAGQVAQGSATKQSAPGERGRNEPNSARANSLPAPSRRSNSADAGMGDARKNQATDRNRGPKGSDNANIPPAGSSHERRFENGPKSAEFKDIPRESRADRGRGSHRGRGGFGGSQNSHYPNNHMSHNGFMHPKSFGFGERRSQQHSSGGHRMSLRSPSLPNSGSMYGVYPFPTDINTMYGYQPVHPGPMTAVPYQQYMEPFSLMRLVPSKTHGLSGLRPTGFHCWLQAHQDSDRGLRTSSPRLPPTEKLGSQRRIMSMAQLTDRHQLSMELVKLQSRRLHCLPPPLSSRLPRLWKRKTKLLRQTSLVPFQAFHFLQHLGSRIFKSGYELYFNHC